MKNSSNLEIAEVVVNNPQIWEQLDKSFKWECGFSGSSSHLSHCNGNFELGSYMI